MTGRCPHCGNVGEPCSYYGLTPNAIRLPPQLQRMLAALIVAQGLVVGSAELLRQLAGAPAGAEQEDQRLKVRVCQLRAVLKPLGWGITAYRGRGYALEQLQAGEQKP
jgi:DNA-binding response OmpR family regulator